VKLLFLVTVASISACVFTACRTPGSAAGVKDDATDTAPATDELKPVTCSVQVDKGINDGPIIDMFFLDDVQLPHTVRWRRGATLQIINLTLDTAERSGGVSTFKLASSDVFPKKHFRMMLTPAADGTASFEVEQRNLLGVFKPFGSGSGNCAPTGS
jgi:hypothetical protein